MNASTRSLRGAILPPMAGRHYLVALVIILACNSSPAPSMSSDATRGDSGGNSETGQATALTGGVTSTSTIDLPAQTTALGTESTSSATTNTTDTGPSNEPNDCSSISLGNTCEPWSQDCPEGQKCNWYSSTPGGGWEDSKCFPIMDSPAAVGEPCFVVDNFWSGIDNCERGAMCWDTDSETKNVGTCVELCGCPDTYACPTKSSCWVFSYILSLCFESCNPLTQDCLVPGELCSLSFGYGNGFKCVPDASGDQGQPHDPCEYLNECDPGSFCLDVDSAAECDPLAMGCCQPFCDTSLPNTCPGQGQECLPVYNDGDFLFSPEFPNVGLCTLPG